MQPRTTPPVAPGPPRAQAILSLVAILVLFPVVSIPFLLFWAIEDKASKKLRDARTILYIVLAGTFVVAGSILATLLYVDAFTMTGGGHDPVPVELLAELNANTIMHMVVLGLTFLFALFTNRLAVNILNHEEHAFRKGRLTFWHKVTYFFKWKNEHTTLASGNETMFKLKNAATVLAFTSALLLAMLPLFLSQGNFEGVMGALFGSGSWDVLEFTEIAITAGYMVLIGIPFVLSSMLLWFYMGRAFSYQGAHNARRGTRAWVLLRAGGYVVSMNAFIPLVLSLFILEPFLGLLSSACISILSITCWVAIALQFKKDPRNLALDPKVLAVKVREGVLDPARDRFPDPRCKNDLVKKGCFGIMVTAMTGISLLNAAFWFQATALYAPAVEWYESGFYVTLGLLITAGPCIMLLFLRSVYARRLLMASMVIVMIVLAQELFVLLPFHLDFTQFLLAIVTGGRTGYTWYIDRLDTGSRPGHVVIVWLVFVLAFVSFYILKRKAIPIEVTTRKHERLSFWKNARAFIFSMNRRRLTVTNVAMLGFLVMVSGTFLMMEPPVVVTLPRPASHHMRVSFWESGLNLPNSTLEILGEHDIRLFGWISGYDDANARRYAQHGVQVALYVKLPQPAQGATLANVLQYVTTRMDHWDAQGLRRAPYIGFTFDQEDWKHVHRFNETAYRQAVEWTRELNEYINARGYELFLTEYMTSINDLLDADHDVSINTFNPFDLGWNVSHFDWMIYRTEIAIAYNEPSVTFTYEWARHIRRFMLEMGGASLYAKASMSIGVTSDQLPLYRDPGGLDEFLLDVKVCHAMEISNVIIFYLPYFLDKWGEDGLTRMMDELDTYNRVSFTFKRRATFMGNLKREDNPTGSAFGFMYMDAWLDEWVGTVPLACLLALATVPIVTCGIRFGRRKRAPPEPERFHRITAIDAFLVGARVALLAFVFASIMATVVVFFDVTVFQWF